MHDHVIGIARLACVTEIKAAQIIVKTRPYLFRHIIMPIDNGRIFERSSGRLLGCGRMGKASRQKKGKGEGGAVLDHKLGLTCEKAMSNPFRAAQVFATSLAIKDGIAQEQFQTRRFSKRPAS